MTTQSIARLTIILIMDSTTSSPRDELEILLNTPALYPPPLGTIPVFDNPPNGNSTALKGTFACVAIEVLFSLARVYTRIFLTKKVKIEDCKYRCCLSHVIR